MEYMKTSMASNSTRKFIKGLIYNDILCSKNAQPDLSKILTKIETFDESIVKSIKSGSREYFKKANAKTMDAYEDPFRIGTFKAAFAWNYLCPNNQLELPGVAYIVKINAKKLSDLTVLTKDYPEIFERFKELFDIDIQIKDVKTGAKVTKKFGASGISGVAIPVDSDIPDWIRLIVDSTEIVESNTKLLIPVLESLGIHCIFNTKSQPFTGGIVNLD